MDSDLIWQLFCQTGDPAAYMLYCAAEKEAGEQ